MLGQPAMMVVVVVGWGWGWGGARDRKGGRGRGRSGWVTINDLLSRVARACAGPRRPAHRHLQAWAGGGCTPCPTCAPPAACRPLSRSSAQPEPRRQHRHPSHRHPSRLTRRPPPRPRQQGSARRGGRPGGRAPPPAGHLPSGWCAARARLREVGTRGSWMEHEQAGVR